MPPVAMGSWEAVGCFKQFGNVLDAWPNTADLTVSRHLGQTTARMVMKNRSLDSVVFEHFGLQKSIKKRPASELLI